MAAAPVMLGAIFMVHFPRFSFVPTKEFPMGGFEFQLLLLGVALYFVVSGNAEKVISEQEAFVPTTPTH